MNQLLYLMSRKVLYVFLTFTFSYYLFINTACKPIDRTQSYSKYDFTIYRQELLDFKANIQLMSEQKIKKMQKNLQKNNDIWKEAFEHRPEMMNVQLFDSYLQEDHHVKYKNDVSIQNYLNTFRKFLQDPGDINTKELMDCIAKLRKQKGHIEACIHKQCADFNNLDIKFTKVTLEWLKYWNFIMEDADYIHCDLVRKLELGSCILSVWQEQRRKEVAHASSQDEGRYLWDILSNELCKDNDFNKNNKESISTIVECLEKLYIWSVSPVGFYNLSIKDYQKTIPCGLKTLSEIIESYRNTIKNGNNKQAMDAIEELEIYVNKAKKYVTIH